MSLRHVERIFPLPDSNASITVWRVGDNVRLDMIQPINGIATQDMTREQAAKLANAILTAAGF